MNLLGSAIRVLGTLLRALLGRHCVGGLPGCSRLHLRLSQLAEAENAFEVLFLDLGMVTVEIWERKKASKMVSR